MQLDFKGEFQAGPIRTTAAATALLVSAGSIAWALIAPHVSAGHVRPWVPPFLLTSCFGAAGAVLALSVWSRGFFLSLVVAGLLLIGAAGLSARAIVAWGPSVFPSDTFLAGLFAYSSFMGVVGERVLRTINTPTHSREWGDVRLALCVTGALVSVVVFWTTYHSSLPLGW